MIHDSHRGHQGLRHDGLAFIIFIVCRELQLVDAVTEVMSDTLFLQVRDQFIDALVII